MPDGTPEPRFRHPARGDAARIFTYQDTEGRLLGHTCLFGTSDGGTTIIPLTWCQNTQDQSRAWRWIQFPAMRPLYGLDELAKTPDADIMLVFDELSAAYGRQLLKNFVFLSWPGGFRKISEVDWSPLRGKDVFIWADHGQRTFKVAKGDPQEGLVMPRERQPTWKAAQQIAGTLRAFQARVRAVLAPNEGEIFPDGWNLARAVSDDWGAEALGSWVWDHMQLDAPREIRVEPPEPALGPPSPAPGAEPVQPAFADADDIEWERELIRKDGSGPLLPELFNVRLIMTRHREWREVIFLDEFSQRVMKGKPPPFQGGEVGEWTDVDDSMAHEWLSSRSGILKLRTATIGQAVQTVAKLNARNPLLDRLRSLKWDGKPRLDTWLKCYVGAGKAHEDDSAADLSRKDEYLRIVGRMWLIGAVARAFRPGVKFDHVLVLEGLQGLGKSGVPAIIGGEWAMDTPFSLSDKEGMENIRGKWIVELAELDAFNKAESTTAKSFFTRVADRFRLPYGKRSADFKRSCVFVGTTNEHEYFRDQTGNRRYWPVSCSRTNFDLEALRRDLDQLLAEAVAAFKAGEQFWPTRQQQDECITPEQDLRAVPDTWIGRIAWWIKDSEWLQMNPGTKITVRLLLEKALLIDPGRTDQHSHATRVGRALIKLGYRKIEDKSLPDRFYYVKRPAGDKGDDE